MDRAEQEAALLRLAQRVTDGEPIDWEREERTTSVSHERVRHLRIVERIGKAHEELLPPPTAATPATLPFPAWGRLELVERVAVGGFGEVFRAHDRDLDRTVALKLCPETGPGAPTDGNFVEEARLLARVRHENVVVVHGVDRFEGRAGLWMEWLEGEQLDRLVARQGPLSAREAAHLGIDLCRALAAVHAAGLVHRDVKLSNVRRERGGRLVLMDFGLSTRRKPDGTEGTPPLAGTPPYIAPETFAGRDSGKLVDIYALGVSLYHLTTGAYPLEADTLAGLRQGHLERAYVSLRARNASLPTAFVQIVERALDPDPARRYASVADLERDLAGFIGAVAERERPRPGAWRAVAAWLAGAAVVAAALLGAYTFLRPFDVEAVFYRLNQERGTEERLVDGARIAPGDQLFLDVETSRPTWFYVINEDSVGRQHALFPGQGIDRTNPVPAGAHRLPGTAGGVEQMWDVDTVGGEDRLLVVASRRPLDFVEARIADLLRAPGAPADLGTGDLAERLRGIGGLSPPAGSHRAQGLSEIRKDVTLRSGQGDGVRMWELVLSNPE